MFHVRTRGVRSCLCHSNWIDIDADAGGPELLRRGNDDAPIAAPQVIDHVTWPDPPQGQHPIDHVGWGGHIWGTSQLG